MHNGLKMITNELKRVALVRVAVIVAVHQRHIHRAVHMVLAMEMVMHQIWAPYQRPHRVCSIQHQVSISLFHIGRFIEEQIRFFFFTIPNPLTYRSCA